MPDMIAVLLIVASAIGYIVYRYGFKKSGSCSCGSQPGPALACSGCCHCATQKAALTHNKNARHACCQAQKQEKHPLDSSSPLQQHRKNNMRTINLRQMQIGETATVTAIAAQGELGRRIRDMGLVPGATVEIVGRAPLKDPVALQLQGFTLTLRNNEADWITVTLP